MNYRTECSAQRLLQAAQRVQTARFRRRSFSGHHLPHRIRLHLLLPTAIKGLSFGFKYVEHHFVELEKLKYPYFFFSCANDM